MCKPLSKLAIVSHHDEYVWAIGLLPRHPQSASNGARESGLLLCPEKGRLLKGDTGLFR